MSDATDGSKLVFEYGDGSSWTIIDNETSSDIYRTVDFNTASPADGDYELRVNDTGDDQSSGLKTLDVTLDNSKPQISFDSPSEITNDDSPTVEVSGSDQFSDIKNISISVENSDNEEEDSKECTSASCSMDLSDLSDGDYSVDAEIYDEAGNRKTDTEEFTVDTSYDGDTSAEFGPEPGIIQLEDGGTMDLDVTLEGQEDGESGDIIVTCYDGDDEEIDSASTDIDEDETKTFTCNVDGEDYAGTTQDIYVEMCDEAGNCDESDERTYEFDARAPTLTDVDTSSGIATFNSNFDLEFDVSDDASGVDRLEYYFESGTEEGEGNEVTYSDGKASFTVDNSGLTKGTHIVYIRAKDNADRWSDPQTFEFDFFPNAEPKVSVTGPENIEVNSGSSKDMQVEVSNTGKFLINSLQVRAQSDIYTTSKTIGTLEVGDSVTNVFTINPTNSDIGSYEITFSTNNPSASYSTNLRIKANQQQQQQISSEFEQQKQRFDEIKQNITKLKAKVSEQKRERMESNFSDLESSIESAEGALEAGDYYQVQAELSDIDPKFSKASDSYSTVKTEYQESRKQMMIFGIVGLVLLLSVGGAVYAVKSGEYDLDLDLDLSQEDGEDSGSPEVPFSLEALKNIPDRIKTMLDSDRDEAEEFEWDGFKN